MWSSLPLWRFRPSGTAPDVNQKRLSGTSCFWWRKSLSALPPCHRKFLSMRKPFCPRKNFLQKMMSYGMTMSFSPMRTSLWKKTYSSTRWNCSDGCCPDSLRCRSRGKKTLTKTYSLTRRNCSDGCCPASLRCRSRGKKTLTKTYSSTRRNRSCGCCPDSLRCRSRGKKTLTKTYSSTRRNRSCGCCPDSLRCRSRGKKTLTKTYSSTRRNRSCGCCPDSLRCRSRGKKTLTKTYSSTRRNRSCGCCPASLRTQKILNSLWKRSLHFSLKPNQSSLRMTNQNSLWKKNFWTMSGSVTTWCCSSNRRSVFPVSMNQPVMR